MNASIEWVDAHEKLPADDMTVLVALDDGEVWTGFMDGGVWRYVSADEIEAEVKHWAEFPEPPNVQVEGPADSATPQTEKGN